MVKQKPNEQHLTLSAIAESLGITKRTIHHYRKLGILKPPRRIAAGLRALSPEDIDKLALILKMKDLDIPLKEIAVVAGNYPLRATNREQISPDFVEILDRCIEKIDGKIASIFSLRRDVVEYRLRINDLIAAKGQRRENDG